MAGHPRHPSLLSEDEVHHMVSSLYPGRDVTVHSFSWLPAHAETSGFMGCHHRLLLSLHVDGRDTQRSLFVKSVPYNNQQQWEYVVTSGAFEKEVQVYTKLFEDVERALDVRERRWHPGLVYSREDILVMEDLSQDGFRLVAAEEPLDLEHVVVALRTLAYMHGQCLVLETKVAQGTADTLSLTFNKLRESKERVEIKDLYPVIAEETIYNRTRANNPFTRWMDVGPSKVAVVADLLDGYSASERTLIREKLPEVLCEVYSLTEYSTRFKNCFNQGDGWLNNLMFRYEGGRPVEARLVDYQLCRYLPPTHDVMEVFCLTTTREFRDKHEDFLRDLYYRELDKEVQRLGGHLASTFPYTEYCESWSHYKKLGLLRAGIILNVVLTPAAVSADAQLDFDEFILEGRDEFIRRCFQHTYYKDRLSQVYNEIIEKYILNQ